ncbi:MAG: 4-hydroxy-tetrahydrodipicolinate synthase [Candidatus Marsarchaeota archaeon]|nr:4-hydroxy-tetrahydrodipicolinate synthase [Candidatus Marsarchaeota archaeon]
MTAKPSGVIVPVVTPFNPDYSLNLDEFKKFVDHLIEKSVNGIFPLGTNGEFALLNPVEKQRVIEAAVEAAGGRVPVLAGISDPSTMSVIENAKIAARLGADYVVATAPYYYRPKPEGIYLHFKSIADSSPLPLVIYNIPSNTFNEIPLEVLQRLSDHPNILGMKYTTRDMPSYIEALALRSSKFSVMMGTDSLIYSALELGSDGVVSGLANAAPAECETIFKAVSSRDLERGMREQMKILPLAEAMFIGNFPAAVKEMVNLLGFRVGPVRPPLSPLTERERNTVAEAVKKVYG